MLEKNINEVLLNKQPSAKSLVQMIVNLNAQNDFGELSLYHQFPLYPDETGNKPVAANLLLVSKNYGILIFQCLDYSERTNLDIEEGISNLDEIDRLIFAKILKDAPSLQKGRRGLKIDITPIIFLHNCTEKPESLNNFDDFHTITSEVELKNSIFQNKAEITDEEYRDLKATIEGSKGLAKPVERKLKDKNDFKNSKGALLSAIENQIYNFDLEQKRAALFTLDGPQRIRGLAGSGKTIILAMKAAMIHLQYPDAQILYTYYTKSLQGFVKRLITRFYRQFAEKDPNWDKIHILHAWGGKVLAGVYYNACVYNSVPSMNLLEAKKNRIDDPFDYACEKLNEYKLKKQYDYTLLDEAQDFPKHFYRVCRQITKNNRVVWAYDDFQNILDVHLQNEKETFGKDEEGNWHIDFSTKEDQLQDLVLYKCYRNPRKILISAFALGLGIYNKDSNTEKVKIIQRLESNDHWESLGFKVEEGNSNTGDSMVISRPEENSPLLKNLYLDDENVILRVKSLKSLSEECEEVSKMILKDLEKELLPEDISVICLDNRNVKKYFSVISDLLRKRGLKTFNLLDAPTDNTVYKVQNHITLSTIYKAKGNEAGSIYIMGIDSIFLDKNNITERNKIFTAMTRSLGWVTLTGLAPVANICIDELKELEKNRFKLTFIQPSETEVKTIIQDINKKQAALNKIERVAENLAKELNIPKEEIVEDIKSKLLSQKK